MIICILFYDMSLESTIYAMVYVNSPLEFFVKLKNCGRGCCSDILLYPI